MERYREGQRNSFWGDLIYDAVVPKSHFLRQLADLLDWEDLVKGYSEYYKGGAEYGPIPYHPSVLLKMLIIAYLYKLSERQVEAYAQDSLAARYFLGIAANESVPDHSTLSVFRERVLAKGGVEAFEDLLRRVIREARTKGIKLGKLQVVDATHSLADIDVAKDDERHDQGKGKPRRDKDASWGAKGRKKVRTADGKSATVNKTFYGYKAHLSLNAESGLITAVLATTGKVPDGQQFPKLVAKDEAVGVEAEIYAGDKAYDDGENHDLLWSKGKASALTLNGYRTSKKDGNKEPWVSLKASESYQLGRRERYKVEQKFGEGKRSHGWGRCRYLGLKGYSVQSYLTALVLNLKRMVRLLGGISLRGQITSLAHA